MEKITIVIPVYNSEKYIKKCIESVINQTYENLEILIIIDGATDASQDIIEEYAQKDTRIQIIKRENKGVFYTRIEGIQKATSDYIYFLDADDWIEENTIEAMYNYLKQYSCQVVRCQNYYKDKSEKVESADKVKFLKKEDFKNNLYERLFGSYDFASIWNQLIQKKYFKNIEDIDYTINYGEDYLLNLKLYKNIDSIILVPDYFYHYRTNQNSITNQQTYEGLLKNLNSTYKSHLAVVDEIEDYHDIQEKEKYKKIAIFRAIRGLKNRIIEFGSFGIKRRKEKEVYKEIEKIVTLEKLKEVCGKITLTELLQLAQKENHKYIIKNIYLADTKRIVNYIKRIYIPGKKIKKLMRR